MSCKNHVEIPDLTGEERIITGWEAGWCIMAVDCVEYNVCDVLVYVYCVIQKPVYICPPHFPQITHQCIFKPYRTWVRREICMFNFPLFSFRPSYVNAACRIHTFGIKRQGMPGNASRIRRPMYMNWYSYSLQTAVFHLYKSDFWFSWVWSFIFRSSGLWNLNWDERFGKKNFHHYQVTKRWKSEAVYSFKISGTHVRKYRAY
jgi:hypothetical protein